MNVLIGGSFLPGTGTTTIKTKKLFAIMMDNRSTPAIAVVNAETSTKLDHVSEEQQQNNEVDNDDDDVSGVVNLTLHDITEQDVTQPPHPRGIPTVKFLDNVTQYVQSFTPPATAELLIGAYTQLHTKYKLSETSLLRKRTLLPTTWGWSSSCRPSCGCVMCISFFCIVCCRFFLTIVCILK
jgi:hypothetical protein